MPKGGINGRKRNFGKLNTPMGDFDWLGAQSNYRVKYFEGSNYVKMTETQNQTVPKVCKKIAKSMQNLFKRYAKCMQNVCKYYAKKIAKIMQKVLKKLCKKDTVMHCTLIYTQNMPDMVKYRAALWHFRQLAFGNWHFWHLALLASRPFFV